MNDVIVRLPRKLQRIQIIRGKYAADAQPPQFEEFGYEEKDLFTGEEVEEEKIGRAQVEHELKNAYDRGFQDGQEVAAAMLEKDMLRHEEWLLNFDNIVLQLQKEFSYNVGLLEQSTVALGIEIAKHILQREAQGNTDVVVEQARCAFEKLQGTDKVVVRLNPFNIEAMKKVQSALLAESGVRSVEIISDGTIERGGCILETNIGAVDAQISTQLEELLKQMMTVAQAPKQMTLDDLMRESETD